MILVEDIVDHGHGYLDASYLFVHETANPGATARNHRDLYSRGDWKYSVQYVCDWTGVVYHTMPDDCLAWAVGNGNRYGVNLEICHATNEEDFRKAWDTATDFCAWYLKNRGWTIDRMMSHEDCRIRWGGTTHTDPIGYFRSHGRTWDDFRNDVYAKMNDVPVTKDGDEGMKEIRIPEGKYDVYRVYNAERGDHHYTSSLGEVQALDAGADWFDEGTAWTAPDTGAVVYRMYNHNHGDHYWTTSFQEVLMLEETGWKCEGSDFASARPDDPDAIPVYQLYHEIKGDPEASDHLYTTSEDERDQVSALDNWTYEKVAFYAIRG